ncbi:hypothetical protein [Myceligenerans indicum]|uniref:Uncharacterized protein n=1 Tax=Myceligenerans indicum TaxID=2593663 RepID=A0ABS1LKL3_9MICO|nr:hypothetical protein [Myceligenerans indicum]MBL0886554.1 hypothetical protein [Myceligenerans indicum]
MTERTAPAQAGGPTAAWAMLLPPGWARFPTGAGRARELDAAIEQVVARALPDTLPRDTAEPHRRLLRDTLHSTLAEAVDAGAGAVYLPTEPLDGVMVPASITEVELVSDAGANPVEVAAGLLTDGYEESDLVELDGRPGVRLAHTEHAVRRDGDVPELSTHQVVYAVSRDEALGEWLVLSFSTVWNSEDSERLAEALVLFFDAVMGTFRWAGPGASPLTLPDRAVPGSAPPRT